MKPTVKPTPKSTPVPREMLKAVVATNKAENAVRCWLIKMVLFHPQKKKLRVIHFWILCSNSKQISCWRGRKLQLNVCLNHMLNFKRSDIIKHHVWTQEETQENKAKASEALSQLRRRQSAPFQLPLANSCTTRYHLGSCIYVFPPLNPSKPSLSNNPAYSNPKWEL